MIPFSTPLKLSSFDSGQPGVVRYGFSSSKKLPPTIGVFNNSVSWGINPRLASGKEKVNSSAREKSGNNYKLLSTVIIPSTKRRVIFENPG